MGFLGTKKEAERKILKVHELTSEIRSLLETTYSDLWVEGEISDLRNPRSGHLYFTLKDSGARISAVIFKSHLRFLRLIPKEGEHVLIRAHLSLYEPRGEYQLICDYIEPRGAGALQAAFEQLKEKLRLEGLFHPDRKQDMPLLPMSIGIITSSSGAAIQDIIKVIESSAFNCRLLLHPVRVQGFHAADEIADALDEMNAYRSEDSCPLDLLLLTRGGGSLEDLWAFNEEPVARAIARSKIPIISAVGHESDTTISDYVSDLTAPTPSIAAGMIVEQGIRALESVQDFYERLIFEMKSQLETHQDQIVTALRLLTPPRAQIASNHDQIDHLQIRLMQSIARFFEERRASINKADQGLSHLSPMTQLTDLKQQQSRLDLRLFQAGKQMIDQHKNNLQGKMDQLHLVSPLNVLERGYSITRKLPLLEVIRESSEVAVGDRLQIKLHQGELTCVTEEKGSVTKNLKI